MERGPLHELAVDGFDDRFLASVRDDMIRFAQLQLGSDDEVEDAVQEALAGALRNAAKFRGEAALKTWMIAILKNKVADIIRQRQRRPLNASALLSDDQEGALPPVFDQRGMWRDANKPARWEDPEAGLHSSQFLSTFDACLNRLPAQQGRVFLMREVVELDSHEICAELGLSMSNVHVILHRARLALRACLQHHWFDEGGVK
ncbi:MAG: sigma-70 family RNA polymerase sigma factor [Sphingorhabdus sp.]|uniref:sigma-70 family RNA polymerase sigma factor n=1 Tax=Sphingorhabdus sp. TaxID=1902408 RepID=UPI003CA5AA9E